MRVGEVGGGEGAGGREKGSRCAIQTFVPNWHH